MERLSDRHGVDSGAARRPQRRRPTVVIADDGAAASVVVLHADHPSDTGAVFEHNGQVWVIRGRRVGSRVRFAEPATARH